MSSSRSKAEARQARLLSILSGALARARPRDGFWCWTCPEAEAGFTPIVLTPRETDGVLRKLKNLKNRVARDPDSLEALGTAKFDDEGVFTLYGELFRGEDLTAIAAFVRDHVDSCPELGHLVGARIKRPDGLIDAPDLWEGLTRRALPTTRAHAIETLAALRPGQQTLFLMLDKGPDGEPFLMVQSDPEADETAFARDVARVRARISERGSPPVFGTVRVFSSWLAFSAANGQERWASITRDLAKRPGLERLGTSRFIHMQEGRIVAGHTLDGGAR